MPVVILLLGDPEVWRCRRFNDVGGARETLPKRKNDVRWLTPNGKGRLGKSGDFALIKRYINYLCYFVVMYLMWILEVCSYIEVQIQFVTIVRSSTFSVPLMSMYFI